MDSGIVRRPRLAGLRGLFGWYGVRSSVIYSGARSFRALYVIKSTRFLKETGSQYSEAKISVM